MYKSGNIISLPKAAATALTAGRFVRLVGGLIVYASAGTEEDVVGVTTETVTAADAQDTVGVYMINGANVVEVEASAAITLGAQVASGADGRAADAGASDVPNGIALSAASAAGEFVDVLLTRLGAAT